MQNPIPSPSSILNILVNMHGVMH